MPIFLLLYPLKKIVWFATIMVVIAVILVVIAVILVDVASIALFASPPQEGPKYEIFFLNSKKVFFSHFSTFFKLD